MKKILFFNEYYGGHQLEFVNHVLEYMQTNNPKFEPFFLLNHQMESDLAEVTKKNLTITILEPNLTNFWNELPVIQRASLKTKWLGDYAKKHSISHIFLFNLDEYQLEILKSYWKKSNFSYSGILFGPFVPIPNQKKTLITKLRKGILNYLTISSKNLRKIFILNSDITVSKLASLPFIESGKVVRLSDPINIIDLQKKMDKSNLKSFHFLVSGYINERKGLQNVFKALIYLHKFDNYEISLTIAGQWDMSFYEKMLPALGALKSQLHIDNKYLSNTELHHYFENTHAVSLLYDNFYYSSGLLGLSALHQKPVLSFEYGIIGEMTQKYHLGLSIVDNKPSTIAEGMLMLQKEYQTFLHSMNHQCYVNERTGQNFARSIISELEKV